MEQSLNPPPQNEFLHRLIGKISNRLPEHDLSINLLAREINNHGKELVLEKIKLLLEAGRGKNESFAVILMFCLSYPSYTMSEIPTASEIENMEVFNPPYQLDKMAANACEEFATVKRWKAESGENRDRISKWVESMDDYLGEAFFPSVLLRKAIAGLDEPELPASSLMALRQYYRWLDKKVVSRLQNVTDLI
jgi:hypothetical protein